MARPTKYNEKIANHLLDLLRQGHSFRDVCFGVGISEDMLIRWRKSDSDFTEQVDSAKNQYWSSESTKNNTPVEPMYVISSVSPQNYGEMLITNLDKHSGVSCFPMAYTLI